MSESKKITSVVEEGYDLIALLKQAWRFKFFIVICVGLGIAGAHIYKQRTASQYEVFATLIIKNDRESSVSLNNLFDNLDFNPAQNEIESEIAILSSYSIVSETLKELDFKVSYFVEFPLRTQEIYETNFYYVELDPTVRQLVDQKFVFTLLDPNQVEISYQIDNGLRENPLNNADYEVIINPMEYTEVVSFGEWIETPLSRFRLHKKTAGFNIADYLGGTFSFVINSEESLINTYHNNLAVEVLNESSALKLSLVTPVVAKGMAYLNTLNSVYINLSLQEKRETANLAIQFIDLQLNELEKSLLAVQQQLEVFQLENEIVDPKILVSESYTILKNLEEQKFNLQVQMSYFEYLQESMVTKEDTEIVSPSVVGISDPSLLALLAEYKLQREEYLRLKVSLKPDNPYFNSFRERQNLNDQLLEENLSNLIASTKLQIEKIEERKETIKSELKTLPKAEYKLANLQRRLTINDEVYTFLLQRKSEAEIAKASTVSQKTVLDPARLSGKVSPVLITVYFIGFSIGLIFAVIVISAQVILNKKIKTFDQFKRLIGDHAFLGSIPKYDGANAIAVSKEPSNSLIVESFQTLRLNLKYLNKKGSSNVYSVTSFLPGEGKTFVSVNLSLLFAKTGKRTLLIGSDMRKPKIADDFGLKNSKGLSQILIGELTLEEAVFPNVKENLDILLSGLLPPNPIELIERENFRQLIEKAREQYDIVILDTAPVGLVSDWKIIYEQVDHSLYVVRENHTQIQSIGMIDSLRNEEDFTNVSIVYNNSKVHRVKYKYGYHADTGNFNRLNRFGLDKIKGLFK